MQEEIVRNALASYNLSNAHLTFLGRSQNTTFRVEALTGEKFLIRLHSGFEVADDNSSNIWRKPSVIESELLWLAAIAQDMELVVPQPVQNCSGEWVTSLTISESEPPVPCSLLRWVEGEHLADKPTAKQVQQLGQLMAQMHQHSSHWSPPSGFFRPTHGVAQLKSAISQLSVLVQDGIISAGDYQGFQKATAKAYGFIKNLRTTPDTWGLIHADLHRGNYVIYGEEIRPIDFSRCGFGFYLYDIGEAVSDFDASLRPHFFKGYTSIRTLPLDFQRIVEAFFVGSTVENFAFLSANPQEYEWLSQAIPDVIENSFYPYLNGENFLFAK